MPNIPDDTDVNEIIKKLGEPLSRKISQEANWYVKTQDDSVITLEYKGFQFIIRQIGNDQAINKIIIYSPYVDLGSSIKIGMSVDDLIKHLGAPLCPIALTGSLDYKNSRYYYRFFIDDHIVTKIVREEDY